MRILLVTGFQHLPQMYGGVMSNTHELALEMQGRGHQPFVVAGVPYELKEFSDLGLGPDVPTILAGSPWSGTSPPIHRHLEFPLDQAVVTFDAR